MLAKKTFLTVPSAVFTIRASPLTTSTTVAVYSFSLPEIWYKKDIWLYQIYLKCQIHYRHEHFTINDTHTHTKYNNLRNKKGLHN